MKVLKQAKEQKRMSSPTKPLPDSVQHSIDVANPEQSETKGPFGWNEPQNSGSDFFVPISREDINITSKRVLAAGAELEADHPGFKDPEYRKRRALLVELSKDYKYPNKLPVFPYTQVENGIWKHIYSKLFELFPKYACSIFNNKIKSLNYPLGKVPQLQAVSDWLTKETGFCLFPTGGLLSSRDFLASLAFRIFQSTSYIRHGAKPLYTRSSSRFTFSRT